MGESFLRGGGILFGADPLSGVFLFVTDIQAGRAAVHALFDGEFAEGTSLVFEHRITVDNHIVFDHHMIQHPGRIEHHRVGSHIGCCCDFGGVCDPAATIGMTLAPGVLQMPLGRSIVFQSRQRCLQLLTLFWGGHGNGCGDESFPVIHLVATSGEHAGLVDHIVFKQRGVRRTRTTIRKRHVIRIAIPESALVHHVGFPPALTAWAQCPGRRGDSQPVAQIAGLHLHAHLAFVP